VSMTVKAVIDVAMSGSPPAGASVVLWVRIVTSLGWCPRGLGKPPRGR
jgi:hypothetical protein